MNPFRRLVTVGHNARAFVSNRRPTEQEETVKQRSEGDMQRDAWYWGQARSNPPPECLWRLWRSASTLTEPFRPDGNIFYWCIQVRMSEYETELAELCQSGGFCTRIIAFNQRWRFLRISSWQIQHRIFANLIWQSKQTKRYWVPVSEYVIWAHLFVAKPLRLLAYQWSSGTLFIHIPESLKLRHCSGSFGPSEAFSARVLLACDWTSCTTEIFNPVQNELLEHEWSQLWHAASSYEWYHSSAGMPQERQISHRCTCTCTR